MGTRFLYAFLVGIFGWATSAFAQKGTRIHEAVRLPGHFLHLALYKPKTLEISEVNYGEDKRQYMLICRSKYVEAYRRKAIFYVHGGGWHVGKPEQHDHIAEFLAENGYLVVMPSYRHAPKHSYTELRADVDEAFRQAVAWADENGLCELEWVIGGTSAGGNLAALLAFDRANLPNLGVQPEKIKGFFSIAGALDLYEMPDDKFLEHYAGLRESETFCAANPVSYISPASALPVLCIHGTKDGLVDYRVVESFIEYLCNIRCDQVELYTVPNGTHLAVTAQWYYKKRKYSGQREQILSWLERI